MSKQLLRIYPLFHLLSLFSTSFIEEKHETWYYLLSTYLSILTIEQKPLTNFILLILSRLIRNWNQTGNKWLHLKKELSIVEMLFLLLYLLIRPHNCVFIRYLQLDNARLAFLLSQSAFFHSVRIQI